MKSIFIFGSFITVFFLSSPLLAQPGNGATGKVSRTDVRKAAKNIYIDVHHLGEGKVTPADVAKAHQKDLAVQKKYGVKLIKYWFDEAKGDIYCLSSSPDSQSLKKTHGEAHGLLPNQIYLVKDGPEAAEKKGLNFFLDVHQLGAGNVTAKDVAAAHQKDLDVQDKHGVNFINYWVNEKDGVVLCLSQARDSTSIIKTHTEAHGLVPVSVVKVVQGQ